MTAINAAQLNMDYMYMPTAFLAKPPQPKRRTRVQSKDEELVCDIFGYPKTSESEPKQANIPFKPKNGRRLNSSCLKILTFVNKIRSTFGSDDRLSHKRFEDELKLSHGTVNANLKLLRASEEFLTRKNGVNDYYINSDIQFKEKPYIIIYNFLLEEIGFDKKPAQRLNTNAVLLLSFMLGHYFEVEKAEKKNGKNNITVEDARFVGGKARIATLLNVPESTANDAINELIGVAAIYRHAMYYDDKGNEMICEGKGKSRNLQTVYILNNDLVRLVKKVRAQMDKLKEKRAKKAQKTAQKAEKQKVKDEYKQHDKKAKKKRDRAEQRAQDYNNLRAAVEELAYEETYGDECIANDKNSHAPPPPWNTTK
ncbi:MAG: hypothetical protein NC131_20490 [Roseburia sp.]|nr:hypothetical protein [Roseburia sp.]